MNVFFFFNHSPDLKHILLRPVEYIASHECCWFADRFLLTCKRDPVEGDLFIRIWVIFLLLISIKLKKSMSYKT